MLFFPGVTVGFSPRKIKELARVAGGASERCVWVCSPLVLLVLAVVLLSSASPVSSFCPPLLVLLLSFCWCPDGSLAACRRDTMTARARSKGSNARKQLHTRRPCVAPRSRCPLLVLALSFSCGVLWWEKRSWPHRARETCPDAEAASLSPLYSSRSHRCLVFLLSSPSSPFVFLLACSSSYCPFGVVLS